MSYYVYFFFLVLMYRCQVKIFIQTLSEVIRAEAETCFLLQNMQIKIQMLLLLLMINCNLVLSKVKNIQFTMLSDIPFMFI